MQPQRKLTIAKPVTNFLDIPGCEFTRTQLIISDEITFDEWCRLGDILRNVGGAVQFWIGDWIRFGENKWGEMYSQAIETTGLDYQTLMDAVYVARNVEFSLRNENLTWSHHRAVAPVQDREEQRYWLDKAEDEKLPYRELRRLIDRAQRAKDFRLVNTTLDKIWERIENGCYTVEAIQKCNECGKNVFDLEAEEIKLYMQQLVGSGKAEWRKQGGRKEGQKGDMPDLCVPAGMPAGSDYEPGYRPKVEYGDEEEEHF